ncbi:TPA: ATP-dependent Clp protease proteolytic subunit [Clostridium botulinum]|nr:ATP-dependent Clp protease proteolytic subunit [Clostridium botulinum]
MSLVPVVLEDTGKGERSWDLYSRLLKDRIIFVSNEINDITANLIVAQLLFLDSESDEEIKMYINSPGGSVTAGMAIIDTMNYIKSPVSTVCVGICASMGAMLLSQGEKGRRFALPNSEVMIHQPLGGAKGQATEIEIYAENILKTKKKLTQMIADATGQTLEKVKMDMERDYFLSAEEAKKYGLIDNIIGA